MKIPGFESWFGRPRSRLIIAGVVIVFLCVSSAIALASSGAEGGSKVWGKLDWFRLMNFSVLLAVLVYLLRKPVSQALRARIKTIREQLESLETQKAEAEKRLAQYNDKLSDLENEAQKIVEGYIKQGNEAKAKILKEARQTAEKLQDQARRNIAHEFEKAKQELQREIVEKSLIKAEKTLKKEITDRDQDKLVDEYLSKVVA